MLDAIKAMSAWVRSERSSASKIRKKIEQAIKLEAVQGDVISDVHPRFWAELQAYARAHQQRYLKSKTDIQMTLQRWDEHPEKYAYASPHDMQQNFNRLQACARVRARAASRDSGARLQARRSAPRCAV